MDWLTFFSKTEWPLVGLVAVLVFKKPIAELIDRMQPTSLERFGIKSSWGQRTKEVVEAVKHDKNKKPYKHKVESDDSAVKNQNKTGPSNSRVAELDSKPGEDQVENRPLIKQQRASGKSTDFLSKIGKTVETAVDQAFLINQEPSGIIIVNAWSQLERALLDRLNDVSDAGVKLATDYLSVNKAMAFLNLTVAERDAIKSLGLLRDSALRSNFKGINKHDAVRYRKAVEELVPVVHASNVR